MTSIPVICENPRCGCVWPTTSFLHIEGTGSVYCAGNKVGPCPECGGFGYVPDGRYSAIRADLFDKKDMMVVMFALKELRQYVEAGHSPHDVKREITRKYGFLSGLKRFMPQTSGDLAAWFGAIATAVGVIYAMSSATSGGTSDIHIQQDVAEALEEVFRAHGTSQKDYQQQDRTDTQIKTQKL